MLMMSLLTSTPESVQSSSRLFVGISLTFSFLLGISLALRPRWLLRIVRGREEKGLSASSPNGGRRFRGHHPDCNSFNDHVIEIDGRKVCAGCLGLALGASVSILLTIAYAGYQWTLIPDWPGVLVIIGLILVTINLIETYVPNRSTGLHISSNTLLVIGSCFVTIGVLEESGSAINGVLAIIISFLWLDTRIRISNWRHVETCSRCSEKCKVFA